MLQNLVPVQRIEKIVDIRSHSLNVGAICRADLLDDSLLVVSFLEQIKDFGANHIQTEDLAPLDIQQDSPVRGLSSSNRARDRTHGIFRFPRVYRNP